MENLNSKKSVAFKSEENEKNAVSGRSKVFVPKYNVVVDAADDETADSIEYKTALAVGGDSPKQYIGMQKKPDVSSAAEKKYLSEQMESLLIRKPRLMSGDQATREALSEDGKSNLSGKIYGVKAPKTRYWAPFVKGIGASAINLFSEIGEGAAYRAIDLGNIVAELVAGEEIDMQPEMEQTIKKVREKRPLQLETGDSETMYQAGSTVSSIIQALGGSAILKSPQAMAMLFAISSAEGMYGDIREAGGSPTAAASVSAVNSVAQFYIEKWGLENLVSAIGTRITKGAVGELKNKISKSVLGQIGKGVGRAAAGNFLEEYAETGVERALPAYWTGESVSSILDNALNDGIWGAIGGVFGYGLGKKMTYNTRKYDIPRLQKYNNMTAEEANRTVNAAFWGDDEEAVKAVESARKSEDIDWAVRTGYSREKAEAVINKAYEGDKDAMAELTEIKKQSYKEDLVSRGVAPEKADEYIEKAFIGDKEAKQAIKEVIRNEAQAISQNPNAEQDAEENTQRAQELLKKVLDQKASGLSDEIQVRVDNVGNLVKQKALDNGLKEKDADAAGSLAATLSRNAIILANKRGIDIDQAAEEMIFGLKNSEKTKEKAAEVTPTGETVREFVNENAGLAAAAEESTEPEEDVFDLAYEEKMAAKAEAEADMTPEEMQAEMDEERIAMMTEDGGMSEAEARAKLMPEKERIIGRRVRIDENGYYIFGEKGEEDSQLNEYVEKLKEYWLKNKSAKEIYQKKIDAGMSEKQAILETRAEMIARTSAVQNDVEERTTAPVIEAQPVSAEATAEAKQPVGEIEEEWEERFENRSVEEIKKEWIVNDFEKATYQKKIDAGMSEKQAILETVDESITRDSTMMNDPDRVTFDHPGEEVGSQQAIKEAAELADKIKKIDADRLAFERQNINPELKGRENEKVEAVKINRFFADREHGSDITDEEVIAKLDETVEKNTNDVRVLKNDNGETVTLSKGSLGEMLSVHSSADNIGGVVNKEAIANLPAIFRTAIKIKETDDIRHGTQNKIIRYANVFESDGEPIMVKITVKQLKGNSKQLTDIEFESNNNRDLSAYSLKTAKKNTSADALRESPVDKSYGNNASDGIIVDDLIEYVNTFTGPEVEINGVMRKATNSERKRIAKTEEGLRAFYEWFGDSKVVDKDKRPLVVYHGTSKEFDTFDIKKARDGQYKKGFFFTADKAAARMYGNIIMPVYLKAETDFYESKKTGKSIDYIHPKNDSRDIWIVFDNKQIKSVENTGAFSKDNANIYYHTGEEVIDNSALYNALPQNLKDAVDFIYTGDSVYDITGKEFPNDGTSLNERVFEYYKEKYDNHVEIDGFGDVALDERSIKTSIIHGLSDNKVNAFAAVPEVLKQGKLVQTQENYKGKPENRYLFIAPVTIADENGVKQDYFLEVVVKEGTTANGTIKGKKRFYIHEIELTKKLTGSFTSGVDSATAVSSKSIISKLINDFKQKAQENNSTFYQFNEYDGLKASKSIADVKRLLSGLKPEEEVRLLYDKRKKYWFVENADNTIHNEMLEKAFKQGYYPEFNSVYDARQYFAENQTADDEYLFSFKAQGFSHPSERDVLLQHVGADGYTFGYVLENGDGTGTVLYARSQYDIKDTPLRYVNGNTKVYERQYDDEGFNSKLVDITTYYQFAGEKAQTAALDQLGQAKQLEAAGTDNEQIRQQTGWFKGADGKWRFEISDKDAALDNKALELLKDDEHEYEMTLGELLEHEKLYEAYPELADVKIVATAQQNVSGSYNPDTDTIKINPKANNLKSVIMHEAQHWIQRKEGFARGGNFADIYRNLDYQDEDIVRGTKKVLGAAYDYVSEDEIKKIVPALKEAYIEGDMSDASYELYSKWLKDNSVDEDTFLINSFAVAQAKYERLYGEIEARNTQARMDMTEEERAATSPESTQDIENADAIVIFGDGTAMAYAPKQGELPVAGGGLNFGTYDKQNPENKIFRVMGEYRAWEKTIELFKGHDATTLTHEMLHHYLPIYLKLLEDGGKTDELKDVYKLLGVDSYKQMGRQHWEQLVDWGTSYIFHNQAPNEASRTIFEYAKQWMINAYRTVKKFIKPSPEIETFFEKMLTSEEMPDVSNLAGKGAELAKILQGAKNGQELTVNGLSLRDISNLRKALYARIPAKPETLADAIRKAGGIDSESGMAKALGYDSRRGGETGFWNYKGAIKDERQLIDFLQENGYLANMSEDSYEETTEVWNKVEDLINNRNTVYNEKNQQQAERRESALAAHYVVSELLDNHYIGNVKQLEEDLQTASKFLAAKGAVAVDKATLDYLAYSVKDLEKNYRKLLYANKEKAYDYQSKLTDFIKNLPLDYKHKTAFMNKIRMVRDERTFNKYLDEIKQSAEKMVASEQKHLYDKLIQEEVKSSRPRKVMAQKYDYENNRLFADLREYNRLNQEQAEAALAEFDKAMAEVDEPGRKSDILRRQFLEYKSKGMESSPELMQALYENISAAKEAGRVAKDENDFNLAFERENERQEIIDKLDKSTADKNSLRTQAANVYRRGISNLYSMINSIVGKELADKYEMETVVDRKDQKEWRHLKEVNKQAQSIYKVDSYGDLLNVMADKGQKIDWLYGQDGKKYDVSILDVIDIYNSMKNNKTKKDYIEAYGAEQLNRLLQLLSDEDKALGDMLMEDVNSRFAELNAVYVRTYGMDLKKVDNYWMSSVEHVEPTDLANDYQAQSTTPGFFRERVGGTVTPLAQNAWIKYQKHISASFYMTEVAEKYKALRDTFKSKRIENRIENHFGKGVYQTLMKQIDNLGLNAQSPRMDDVSGFFQKMLNGWVGAKISVNPIVFIGQLTSFTNYAEGVDSKDFIKNIGYALAHPVEAYNFMMKHNKEFLQHRYESGFNEAMNVFLKDAAQTSKLKYELSPKIKFNYSKFLSSFVRTGDIGAIIYGGYGQFKTMLDSGMSLEEAKKKFEFSTLRSQQSGNAASISDWQQQRGISRLFLAFKNTSQQYARKIADTVLMLQHGDIKAEEGAKILANYVLVQPALWVVAKNIAKALLGLSDDDDEYSDGVLEQMLVNPIEAVPFVSDMARYAYRAAAGEKNYNLFSTPMLDDIEKSFRKVGKKEKDVFDYADIITPFVEMFTATPVGTAKRYIKYWYEKWGD